MSTAAHDETGFSIHIFLTCYIPFEDKHLADSNVSLTWTNCEEASVSTLPQIFSPITLSN